MALLWDDKLIGWIVFLRLQEPDTEVSLPDTVRVALERRGWIRCEGEAVESYEFELTEQGVMQADLHAPEWGIDSIPEVEA